MKKIDKKNALLTFSVLYFLIFLIVPFILGHIFERMDLYMKYMFFGFSSLSVIFIALSSIFFKLTKKNWFLLIGFILLAYILSAVYI